MIYLFLSNSRSLLVACIPPSPLLLPPLTPHFPLSSFVFIIVTSYSFFLLSLALYSWFSPLIPFSSYLFLSHAFFHLRFYLVTLHPCLFPLSFLTSPISHLFCSVLSLFSRACFFLNISLLYIIIFYKYLDYSSDTGFWLPSICALTSLLCNFSCVILSWAILFCYNFNCSLSVFPLTCLFFCLS